MKSIKEQQMDLDWALYQNLITESEYIEAKNHIMQLQNIMQSINNNISKKEEK